MALTIYTNLGSINGQRNLNSSSSALSTSMTRLSSGVRVNSAKDDAAGLAIADRMNSQVRGMTVAERNANDGISLTQTAEGALGSLTETLQRMRDLAVQASSAAGVTNLDRIKMQTEYKALNDELTRIIQNSEFNGKKVLNGDLADGRDVQVGATTDTNSRIRVAISDMSDLLKRVKNSVLANPVVPPTTTQTISKTELVPITVSVQADTVAAEAWSDFVKKEAIADAYHYVYTQKGGSLTLNDALAWAKEHESNYVQIGQSAASSNSSFPEVWQTAWNNTDKIFMESFQSAFDKAAVIGSDAYKTAISSDAWGNEIEATAYSAYVVYQKAVNDYAQSGANASADSTTNSSNTVGTTTVLQSITTSTSFTDNNATALAKTNLLVDKAISDEQLLSKDPSNMDLVAKAASSRSAAEKSIEALSDSDPTSALGLAKYIMSHSYVNDSNKTKSANETAKLFFVNNSDLVMRMTTKLNSMETDFSLAAIDAVDEAIEKVDIQRSNIGSLENRFATTIANLQNGIENQAAAKSRIMDADFAVETANLSRNQILQQAGTAMLAQANQSGKTVMALLGSLNVSV